MARNPIHAGAGSADYGRLARGHGYGGRVRVRALLTALATAVAVLGAPGLAGTATAEGPVDARPPDVIVIMTDDQRVGTERAMTNVSRFFSAGGVRYTNAQVPTNLCCPSRASFLTGKYAHTTGVWENSGTYGAYRAFSPHESDTLPRALAQAGYHTGLYGKYMNHFNAATESTYVPPGWDEFHVPDSEEHDGGYYTPVRGLPAGYTPDTMGQGAADFIRTAPVDQPMFLLYAPFAPHYPYSAGPYAGTLTRAKLLEHYRYGKFRNPAFNEKDVSDKPAWVRRARRLGPNALTNIVRGQAESLQAVDANFQRIIDAQAAYRDPANTMVVYFSDNGYAWGEHRLLLKRHPYTLANEIPLWVKYPAGVAPPGRVDDRLANQLDITETISQLAQAPLRTEGLSLIDGPRRSKILLEAAPSRAGLQRSPAFCGFRTHRYLFVYYATQEAELYDLARDPYELRNLLPSRAGMALRLSIAAENAGCDLDELRRMPAIPKDLSGD